MKPIFNTLDTTLRDIEHAFLQLEFAIKLLCYCELGHLNLDKFDTDVTILLDQENISFSKESLTQQGSILLIAQTLVGTTFGISAIILDAAYEAVGITKNIQSRKPEDDLQILVYMVRCAFAHNIASPIWKANGPDFARTFNLPISKGEKIDLTSIHGSAFEHNHIGGLAQWYRIKDAVVRRISNT